MTFYSLWRDGKRHVFMHRYDVEIEHHAMATITRHHVQNHFLIAFDFFRLVTRLGVLSDREHALIERRLGKRLAD